MENISNLSASGLCPPGQVGLVAVVVGSGSYPHPAPQAPGTTQTFFPTEMLLQKQQAGGREDSWQEDQASDQRYSDTK